MKKGQNNPEAITLRKPKKISHEDPWFTGYYVKDSQKEKDRKLFSK